MSKKEKKSKHQRLVDILYCELKQRPWVKEVFKNVEYHSGELDILYSTHNDSFRYVEVKTNNNYKGRSKAKDQFRRFIKIFNPKFYMKIKRGVYYTPQTRFKRDLIPYKTCKRLR